VPGGLPHRVNSVHGEEGASGVPVGVPGGLQKAHLTIVVLPVRRIKLLRPEPPRLKLPVVPMPVVLTREKLALWLMPPLLKLRLPPLLPKLPRIADALVGASAPTATVAIAARAKMELRFNMGLSRELLFRAARSSGYWSGRRGERFMRQEKCPRITVNGALLNMPRATDVGAFRPFLSTSQTSAGSARG
jgi:hypothetical protein